MEHDISPLGHWLAKGMRIIRMGPHTSVVIFSIALWTIVQLFLVWNGGVNQVFNWPDANANYHFAHRMFAGQPFAVPLPFEPSAATSYLATRSTRVVDSSLVPIGFWGLPVIYGFVSRMLFLNVIAYITIFAAAAAAYAWYRIWSKLIANSYAAVITGLLLIHPAWFYYTNETLLPNVVLVSLVIGIFFCLLKHAASKKGWYLYIAACFLALCVMVRPSELIWIVPLLVLAGIQWRASIAWRSVALAGLLAVALSALWFIYQNSILPSSLTSGYYLPQLENARGLGYIARLVAPFGFDPLRTAARAVEYLAMLFWPFTLVSILGIVLAFRKPALSHAKPTAIALCLTAGVLLIQYGSGNLSNTPNPREISIDTSFVRYFLPIYLLSLPFAAHAITILVKRLRGIARPAAATALVALLVVFSFWISMAEPVHGIFNKTQVLNGYDRVASYVISHTPPDALVVTEKGDKYIWPNRLVMVLPKDEGGNRALHYFAVEQGVPTYLVSLQLTALGRSALNEAWKPYNLVVGDELFTQDDIGVYAVTIDL